MKQKDFNKKLVAAISTQNLKRETLDELLSSIKDGPKLSAYKALEVYQEDYQARLTESLRNTYSGILAIIGDEDFNFLSSDYIKQYPSLSPDLDDYGNYLSEFLKTHTLINDYIFLSELAFFEWSFREVFHLEQHSGLSAAELMSALQEDAIVQLCNSVKILDFNYLITALYSLKNADNSEEHFDFEIPQSLLMYKSESMVKTQTISKNQIEIVRNLLKPTTFSVCIQNASANVTPEEFQNLFQFLGTERLIS